MLEKTGDITRLLHQWREGSRNAENELFALVLPNLRRLAHHLMKGELGLTCPPSREEVRGRGTAGSCEQPAMAGIITEDGVGRRAARFTFRRWYC